MNHLTDERTNEQQHDSRAAYSAGRPDAIAGSDAVQDVAGEGNVPSLSSAITAFVQSTSYSCTAQQHSASVDDHLATTKIFLH